MSVTETSVSRRTVLKGAGALVLAFSMSQRSFGAEPARLPGSLAQQPALDAWIRIAADGSVTVFTGKAELGQGIKTALLQVVAEELEVRLDRLQLVTADTARTVDEGYTAGSRSMQDSGTALRNAAAQVREILIDEAARRWKVRPSALRAENSAVLSPDGRKLAYGELVSPQLLRVEARPTSALKSPAKLEVMGQSVPRIDIPAKVTGGAAFIQDVRFPNMLHARIVRPPSYSARLTSVETRQVEHLPGVVKVVRDGHFLAVAARREYQAIKAMHALAATATWEERPSLPRQEQLIDALDSWPAEEHTILDRASPKANDGRVFTATYSRPYIAHGSIGPSCALAMMSEGTLTVWTHAQGVYPLRQAIAEMLHLPETKVRCIHVEGAGCYGHNGADDAAADAALIASHLPGRTIRVQWTREQEHAWEPYGAAMIAKVRASLDASGRIASWEYSIRSNTHTMRPGPAGALLAAQHMQEAFDVPAPRVISQPAGGGDRNAIPLYSLPEAKVVHHFVATMPVRVSALRTLGAHMNVFAIESFMDELARAARADPVEFRLRHLDDARAREVVTLAAERFGWSRRARSGKGRGCGFGFSRYKNLAAYCAVAMEVEVERESGRVHVRRAVAAVDVGQAVNPDGIRNQIEGAILQSMSWALYERVRFDEVRIESRDWSSYPILRFSEVPGSVEVHVLDRPGADFLGCGEAGQGPATAALANAIAAATGKRLRALPMTPERVRAVLD